MSHSEAHRKAPDSADVVTAYRSVFGEVRVLYVKENDVLLGKKQPDGASCFIVPVVEEKKKRKAA